MHSQLVGCFEGVDKNKRDDYYQRNTTFTHIKYYGSSKLNNIAPLHSLVFKSFFYLSLVMG